VRRRLARGTPTIQPVGRLESVSILYPYPFTAVGLYTQRNSNAACWRMLVRRTTSVSQTWMGCPPVSMALSGTPSMILLIRVLPNCLFLHLDLVHTLTAWRHAVNPLLHHGTTGSRFKHVLMDLTQPSHHPIQQLPRPLNHLRLPTPPVNCLQLLLLRLPLQVIVPLQVRLYRP